MKHLWLMEQISRATNLHIGIHTGKRNYYYIVSSKTGEKYYPWVGIVTSILTMFCMGITFISALGIAAFPAEYGIGYWPVSVGLAILTFLSGKAVMVLMDMFEVRPDTYDEDYEPSEEELRDWDKWVH